MTRCHCLLLMAALGVALGASCARRGPRERAGSDSPPVLEIQSVMAVRRSQITESVELVGTLYPWRGATIVSEVDGVIKRLP